MAFFEKLRQLSKTLERESEEVQTRALQYRSVHTLNDEEKEEVSRNAVLVARDLQNDVKILKKEMRENMKSLQNDGSFLELVETAKCLVNKQKENMLQIEHYLQKYGYQPITQNMHSKQYSTDMTTVSAMTKEPSSTEEPTAMSAPEDTASENICEEDVSTPVRTVPEDPDYVKTPKLEDFGLSKELMNYYRDLGQAVRQGQDITHINRNVKSGSVKTGINSSSYKTTTPEEKSQPLNQQRTSFTPEHFLHTGLCPTPGFTGGKDRTCSQDNDIPTETPCGFRSRPGSVEPQPYRADDNSSDFTKMLKIPDPPVLCTPGIKQMSKPETLFVSKPPVFNMEEDNDGLDSPVPPVLMTPGFKQIRKPSPLTKPLPGFTGVSHTNKGSTSDDSDDLEIPEMPQLTFNWTQLQSIRTQYERKEPVIPAVTKSQQQSLPDTRTADTLANPIIQKNTSSIENDSPVPMMPKLTGTYNFKAMKTATEPPVTMTCTTSVSSKDDSPLPAMPELTGVYNFNAESKSTLAPQLCSQSQEDSPLPAMPELTGTYSFSTSSVFNEMVKPSSSIEDSPIPAMPELTGVYNFSTHHTHRPSPQKHLQNSSYVNKDNGMDKDRKYVNKPEIIADCDEGSEEKENVPIRKTRLEEVSTAEYDSQPDYIRRIISLDLLNKTIHDVENVFSVQVQSGTVLGLTEEELQPLLGSKSKSVFLILLRLKRLKQAVKKGSIVYSPVMID